MTILPEKQINIEWSDISITKSNGRRQLDKSNGKALSEQLTVVLCRFNSTLFETMIRFLSGNIGVEKISGKCMINGCEMYLQPFELFSCFIYERDSKFEDLSVNEIFTIFEDVYGNSSKTKLENGDSEFISMLERENLGYFINFRYYDLEITEKIIFQMIIAEYFNIPVLLCDVRDFLCDDIHLSVIIEKATKLSKKGHTVILFLDDIESLYDSDIDKIDNLIIMRKLFTIFSGSPEILRTFFLQTAYEMQENESRIDFLNRLTDIEICCYPKTEDDKAISQLVPSRHLEPQNKRILFDISGYSSIKKGLSIFKRCLQKNLVKELLCNFAFNILTVGFCFLFNRTLQSIKDSKKISGDYSLDSETKEKIFSCGIYNLIIIQNTILNTPLLNQIYIFSMFDFQYKQKMLSFGSCFIIFILQTLIMSLFEHVVLLYATYRWLGLSIAMAIRCFLFINLICIARKLALLLILKYIKNFDYFIFINISNIPGFILFLILYDFRLLFDSKKYDMIHLKFLQSLLIQLFEYKSLFKLLSVYTSLVFIILAFYKALKPKKLE